MTSALTLAGAPTTDLQAASKKYVDDLVGTQAAETLSASGTWTKPAGLGADRLVLIPGQGGAASGANAVHRRGGGGGGCSEILIRAGDLPTSVSYVIGAGGIVSGTRGVQSGNTTFGGFLTAYGGWGVQQILAAMEGTATGAAAVPLMGAQAPMLQKAALAIGAAPVAATMPTAATLCSVPAAGEAGNLRKRRCLHFGGNGGDFGQPGSVPGGGGGNAKGAAGQIRIWYL